MKTETSNEEEEDILATSVLEISEELDLIMSQAYFLNNLRSEIQLIESALERCPQAVVQLTLLILMTEFKRLEISRSLIEASISDHVIETICRQQK